MLTQTIAQIALILSDYELSLIVVGDEIQPSELLIRCGDEFTVVVDEDGPIEL